MDANADKSLTGKLIFKYAGRKSKSVNRHKSSDKQTTWTRQGDNQKTEKLEQALETGLAM